MDAERAEALRAEILGKVREYYHARHADGAGPAGRVAYGGRVFDAEEMQALVDSALDFWLTAGRRTERFEAGLAAYLGVGRCAFVNSGSSANLLAFMALTSDRLGERAVRRGDEVITVAAGFPTTVAPIVQFGAVPVFVDVLPGAYNLDPAALAAALSPRTRAVMAAHTLGVPFDLPAVRDFCRRRGLWLVEDNCDALGARARLDGEWRLTGTAGDLGTSSFYPPHHMTTGEGGAVYTNDPVLGDIVASLRDWGRDCACPPGVDGACGRRFAGRWGALPAGYDHKYVYSHFGYNLKATDMQAAVGLAQLAKLPAFIDARRRNWRALREGLADLGDVYELPDAPGGTEPSWFGFLLTVRADAGFGRDAIVRHLEAGGIQTRMLFAGNLIKHPCFDAMRASGRGYRQVGPLPNTDAAMERAFWVGVYPGLGPAGLARILERFRSFGRGR